MEWVGINNYLSFSRDEIPTKEQVASFNTECESFFCLHPGEIIGRDLPLHGISSPWIM